MGLFAYRSFADKAFFGKGFKDNVRCGAIESGLFRKIEHGTIVHGQKRQIEDRFFLIQTDVLEVFFKHSETLA
jgi:hypothetical protein